METPFSDSSICRRVLIASSGEPNLSTAYSLFFFVTLVPTHSPFSGLRRTSADFFAACLRWSRALGVRAYFFDAFALLLACLLLIFSFPLDGAYYIIFP